jgi:hypothetical protein
MSDAEKEKTQRDQPQMFQSQSMTGETSAAAKAAPTVLLED